jgi:hypothetical protein
LEKQQSVLQQRTPLDATFIYIPLLVYAAFSPIARRCVSWLALQPKRWFEITARRRRAASCSTPLSGKRILSF